MTKWKRVHHIDIEEMTPLFILIFYTTLCSIFLENPVLQAHSEYWRLSYLLSWLPDVWVLRGQWQFEPEAQARKMQKLCVIRRKYGNRIPGTFMWGFSHVQLFSRKRVEWFFKLASDKLQYQEYCWTPASILLSKEVAGQRGSGALEAAGRICTQLYCPENAKDVWIGCDSAIFRTFWLQLIFFSVLKNMNWIRRETKHGKS